MAGQIPEAGGPICGKRTRIGDDQSECRMDKLVHPTSRWFITMESSLALSHSSICSQILSAGRGSIFQKRELLAIVSNTAGRSAIVDRVDA
jgi:hypothetical protein